jgi:NADH-quinone oxidoreductase subunit J
MIFFLVLAVIAVLSGILMITRVNPMNSALFLILNFIALAGMYLTLHAQFVAVIQILVYAGAIMVLVLFVIMLLNLQDEAPLREHLKGTQFLGIAFAAASLLLILQVLLWRGGLTLDQMQDQSPLAASIGTVENIGMALFTDYAYAVILTSVLLLAAMIGAVVLAKKQFP